MKTVVFMKVIGILKKNDMVLVLLNGPMVPLMLVIGLMIKHVVLES